MKYSGNTFIVKKTYKNIQFKEYKYILLMYRKI